MKVGDLVKYGPKMASASGRVGIVVEIHHRVVPTAVVQWNGIKSPMGHRIDLLEVISEGR
jgi:hypothetical protein